MKEKVKKVLADLENGEPFSYIKSSEGLVFGFRMEIDENNDEIEIYHAKSFRLVKYKLVKYKIIKKQEVSIEKIYLWSNLSLIKRFFLLPIYFTFWIWFFIKYYWTKNVCLEFFEDIKNQKAGDKLK